MKDLHIIKTPKGYTSLKERKSTGSHYTPTNLSDFLADQIVNNFKSKNNKITLLDPAMGDGVTFCL